MGATARRPAIKRRAAKPAKTANTRIADEQLDSFIGKYTPEIAGQIRVALRQMRAKLPGAIELVYDNYNALAIGFASGERVADVIFSIACYPRWISLFFFPGVDLEDPKKLLKGSGTRCRHIVLRAPAMLDEPGLSALMQQTLDRAGRPIDARAQSRIIIKSISAKQRPRRPENR